MKKSIIALSSILCMSAMASTLAACGQTSGSADAEKSIVTLDINPSIELVLDSENQVVSVYGTNEDGQVLLYGETESLVGKDVETAIDTIADLSIQFGYLTEENSIVQFDVSAEKGESEEDALCAKISARISKKAQTSGFDIKADNSVPYSILRKYEAYIAEHPEAKISISEFRLALSASETGEITLEAALELDKEELIRYISKKRDEIKEFATKAYNAAKGEASLLYDKVMQAALDNVYATYYMQNLTAHPLTSMYGGMYSMYAMSANSLTAVANAAEWAQAAVKKTLNSEQTADVLTALGMTEEDINALRDANGEITVESVEAYANKLFKNSEAAENIDAMKEELSAALNQAESVINAEINRLSEKYEREINEVIKSAETIYQTTTATLGAISELLPSVTKTLLADFEDVVNQLKAVVEGGITVEEIRTLADTLQEKADDTLALIELDLSEEELAEIEEMKAQIEERFKEHKQHAKEALEKAENEARKHLEERKNARRK